MPRRWSSHESQNDAPAESVAAAEKPHGFTLIEVGIAATLAAIVMGGATALIIGMSRTNNAVRERVEQIAVRSRLAEVFRADVARAKTCTIDEKQPESGILLRNDDQHSVRYVAGEHDVQRIAAMGDEVTARDTFFTLASGSVRHWRRQPDRYGRCAARSNRCRAGPEKLPADAKPRPALIIFAVLARNDRTGRESPQGVGTSKSGSRFRSSHAAKPRSRRHEKKIDSRRRAGAVLLIVMACLAIAMTIIVGWAKIALLEDRQARSAEDRLQAEWLADSAIQRAAAQLLANSEYSGETWRVDRGRFWPPDRRIRAGKAATENSAAGER